MKARAASAIAFLQAILFAAHWFIYQTIVSFIPLPTQAAHGLGITLLVLSMTFVGSAILTFRYTNVLVAWFYKVGAVWLGCLNFLFWAAVLCRIVGLAVWGFSAQHALADRPLIGMICFGLGVAVSVYGLVNARIIRERRVTITLPNLPAAWKGRTALLLSDVHLGNVNGTGFMRRIVKIAQRLDPSIVFIAGDLYDGTKADATRLAAPLFSLAPPFGVFFSGGNHEDFGDRKAYEEALSRGGVHVLRNRRVDVDGLQVIGVTYADSTYPAQIHSFLEKLNLDGGPASVLLSHVPHRLPIVEQFGVNLQVSGHTHGGQFFPFTLATRWVYGKFTYGLQQFGKLQVLTSSGAGTWGPPLRVGTHPEVVLITFS